jgi:hypothetical protein
MIPDSRMMQPSPQPHWPSNDFIENIGQKIRMLRIQVKEDRDFVAEYLHGTERFSIVNVASAGRETIRLIGFDQYEQECLIFVFRIFKKEPDSQRRQYGFTVDSSTE